MNTENLLLADLDFSLGGYFASNVWIKSRNGVIKVCFNQYPEKREDFFIDLKDQSLFSEFNHFDPILKQVIPTEKEWQDFLEVLKITDAWKKDYGDVDICDGTQWILDVYFKLPEGKRKLKRVYCSNEYPAKFELFGKALAKLIRYSKLKNKHKFEFWEVEE